MGGDFFDYLPSGDGRVSVILGDVSGKGLRSAMHAVLSSGLLRTQVRVGGTPGEVLDEVDRELFHLTERNIFTALVFAAIDSRQRKLVLVNAGLPQPLLRRGGEVRLLTLGGLPLGVMPRAQRQTVTAKLETDDLLLFYSDGITEASNLAGEMYSQERLQALVAGVAPDTPAAAVNRLIWEDVDRFVGGAEPFDDMTLVVVRITDREQRTVQRPGPGLFRCQGVVTEEVDRSTAHLFLVCGFLAQGLLHIFQKSLFHQHQPRWNRPRNTAGPTGLR